MNNSYLCWLWCALPLLAPHALFVELFSTRIQTEMNFVCLQLCDLAHCCIYFYISVTAVVK